MTDPGLQLLDVFAVRGVRLELKGGRLAYRAPRGALTPDLHEQVQAHRSDILALLADPRVCLKVWNAAVDRVSDAYDAALAGRLAQGLDGEPPGLDQAEDDKCHDEIREAILAQDLHRTLQVASSWRRVWEKALGVTEAERESGEEG